MSSDRIGQKSVNAFGRIQWDVRSGEVPDVGVKTGPRSLRSVSKSKCNSGDLRGTRDDGRREVTTVLWGTPSWEALLTTPSCSYRKERKHMFRTNEALWYKRRLRLCCKPSAIIESFIAWPLRRLGRNRLAHSRTRWLQQAVGQDLFLRHWMLSID